MTRGRRREHFQWNMDIWGVGGVEAEGELLCAIVTFLERVGLGPQDVGIKVTTVMPRQLCMSSVMDLFSSGCLGWRYQCTL